MQVEIESLAFGGKGVARDNGKVIFVKGGVPRDILDVSIRRDRGSYAEAVIDRIIEPSPERVEPGCPVFGTCGGCQLQNLSYPAQLREKEAMLREALGRIGGLSGVPIDPVFPSPEHYGYRTRVRLAAWFYSGGWHIGYNAEGSRRKVGIGACPISDGPVNRAIFRISEVLSSIGNPRYPLGAVNISSDGESAYVSLIPRGGVEPDALNALARHLGRFEETGSVSAGAKDEPRFGIESSGVRLFTSPSAFTQANPLVNDELVGTVLDWADADADDTVLDLYSGIGNFSLPLARVSGRVESVEINQRSVGFARKSAGLNGITNILFHNAACEDTVGDMLKEGRKFSLIVLDPPREGARGLADGIAHLHPEKVIYVSCDPATLSRDLKGFRARGYEPVRIRPFDMFPQTYHIESVSLLSKI